jgi:hypothetical protein
MNWADRSDRQEAESRPKWTPEPVCSCKNEGKPYLLDGIMVTSRSPSCRVHPTTLSTASVPLSVERVVGNWHGKEEETK